MKTLKLKHPFDFGDDHYKELTLRRPKGKDLRKLPPSPATGDILNLAGDLAGVPPSVVNEMDAEDAIALVDAVKDFLSGSPATGESV